MSDMFLIILDDEEMSTSVNLESDTACIGTFDGMHLGHQELLKRTYAFGNKKYTVVTFVEIPQKTLINGEYKFLTSNSLKESLIKDHKATSILYFNFLNIKDMDPKSFCTLLNKKYGIKKIVVGNDFKFGKDRLGDTNFLSKFFGNNNVTIVPKKKVNGMEVSASLIREHISNGKIELVSKFLGRSYCLEGEIIEGNGLGRKIGFPTANINVNKNYRIPKNGVYIVRIKISHLSNIYFGMINIGTRPTVSNSEKINVEVNIFDFDTNIYGSNLIVDFISFLREEVKFNNIEELKHQLNIDKQTSIKKLKSLH